MFGEPRQQLLPGKELKQLRRDAGFTQLSMSRLLGISHTTVRQWEMERRTAPKWYILILRILAAKRQALQTGVRPTMNVGD